MGSMSGDDMVRWEKAEGRGKEERIYVSVRLRPLNAKEIARNDPSDWDCINNNTIVFNNSPPERTMYPTSYTFADRVFGCECNTKSVYDEGAKEVALSVVNGINASIFAYGQTSSGKTYTMSGVTEYAIKDIYDCITRVQINRVSLLPFLSWFTLLAPQFLQQDDREYALKFSAIEIYNEAVKDLLSGDSSPLRLLDDSERGTVVEKLIEERVRDQKHLKELLNFSKAQRQVGETYLNEASSRSHQILRLVCLHHILEFFNYEKAKQNNYPSVQNFVDLAGSERASQTSSGGRLKEGCHINRSLLTLGTVIRKLSKGRTGHIPYRDSKLTRILQPFLGGNARTAIICTMSPARSHIEQSRNTLSFASCAKQVVTNAQINLVMSDKALVKHLQKELARLENELRYRGSTSCADHSDILKDKDARIKKMEQEIRELMSQRDLAQYRLDCLLRSIGVDDQASRHWDEISQSESSHLHSESEDTLSISGISGITYQFPYFDFPRSEESSVHSKIYPEFSDRMKPSRRSTYEDFEDYCKEVQCIEIHALTTSRSSDEFNLLLDDDNDSLLPLTDEDKLLDPALLSKGNNTPLLPAMEQSVELVARPTEDFLKPYDGGSSFGLPLLHELVNSAGLVMTKSASFKANATNGPVFEGEQDQKMQTNILKESPTGNARIGGLENEKLAIGESQIEETKTAHQDVNSKPHSTLNVVEESQCQKSVQVPTYQDAHKTQLEGDVKESDLNAVQCSSSQSSLPWPLEFERKQREIIQLWHECNVPLVHRTCFFLLFKGDQADAFYIEVECRRLSLLRSAFSHGNGGEVVAEDGHRFSLSSSLRYLRREREMLCKEMKKKLPSIERESVYARWGIALNSRMRKQQLIQHLWTTTDIEHVRESASLVAKLIGFEERGQAAKEMFGLSFTPQQTPQKKAFSWKHLLWLEFNEY
ncbi:kinesin-like protein KIN-7F [Canna indica]|uniref:Kinesin-like protein KIN-7F n=1 Tax=Canna indica TaxID=4628 RepID=A0AAQ3L725_9LILI|nr:kinesin-like protein KIN-7F [Canna indica]